MSLFDFLAHLRTLDIQVSAENGRLRINAPKGAVTPEIREELNERKWEILSLLSGMEPIPVASQDGPMPLSLAQEHLWQLHRLTPHTAAYNMYAVFRLCGQLNVPALEEAVQDVVERHTILRTSFPGSSTNAPEQLIGPASSVVLRYVDLSTATEIREQLESIVEAELRLPFDLLAGPLFRPTLVQVGPLEHVLIFVLHHIISDGHSFGVLYNDLERAYQARQEGNPIDWLPLPLQYSDYAVWQRKWLESDASASDRMYWLSQLHGDVSTLELPIDHPHPLHSTPDGDYVDIKIHPELYTSMQELCRREGVTLFAVVLTAFNILLHRHSGQRDMLVCSPVAARDRTEFSNLIGYFNNTLLLRADLTKARTLVELLHQSQILVMNALTHQTFPFREVSSFPSLARTPLSRGMVAVLEATESPLKLPALDIERIHVFSNAVQYDLSVEMSVFPNHLKGLLMYRTVLFERSTVEKLTAEFGDILEELVTNGKNLILQDVPVHQSHKQEGKQVEKPSHHLPQTDLERRLVHIWHEVLNVDEVGIHDGFFELGGNSLLALRLFTRIEQETGTNLPLSTLFGTTTISHLAKLIEHDSVSASWNVLVPIQPNGSKLPFFAIHGVEGGVLGYRDLARALGNDHPFLGLQAVNQDGLQAYDVSVEAIAAHYIDVMRATQPQGPYRIGGYCFGGVVAYEMARQLEKIGEKVSVLAILEGSMPESKVIRATLLQRLRAIWKSLPAWISDYSGMTLRQLVNRLRSTFHKIWSKIRRNPNVERRMRVEETLDRIDVASLPSHHIKLTDAFMNASGRYTPGVYNGEVLLFRARTRGINEVLFGSLDEKMGWSRLAKGGVNVHLVDGFHRNMHLAPYASSLASELRKYLDEETRAGGSSGV